MSPADVAEDLMLKSDDEEEDEICLKDWIEELKDAKKEAIKKKGEELDAGLKAEKEEKELFSKILTPTDVGFRFSFPVGAMRKYFRLEQGTRSLDFQVNCKMNVWTFRLYTRNTKYGHPRPVLTKGWIDFVRRMGLRVGDKVIFMVHGNQNQLGIRVHRSIYLMGGVHWADI